MRPEWVDAVDRTPVGVPVYKLTNTECELLSFRESSPRFLMGDVLFSAKVYIGLDVGVVCDLGLVGLV